MISSSIDVREPKSPESLFSFETIAVVGASDDPTRIGGAPIHLLKKYGYSGKIYGINPKYGSVQGVPCFAAPGDVPGNIDVAILCVAADRLVTVLPELKRKGLKGAVIFTAGFIETGEEGRKLQEWLSCYARENKIAILGPNCVGQISFSKRRSLTFANAFMTLPTQPAGRTALLSQSGGIATNIWADAALSGTSFSHVITTGNEADLNFSDCLDYLAGDDETDVVLGYVEGLRDGAGFCRAAKRMQDAGKPLVLIKVGTSAAGQDAASSHTGQLSSDDAGYQAAFDRYGVTRVRSLEQLNDYARLFSMKGLGSKVTTATTSGGASVYVADLCSDLGIEMGVLSPETERQLATVVPSFGRVRNPVDLTAQVVNDISILEVALRALLDDAETDVLMFLLSGKGTLEQSSQVISVLTRLQRTTAKTLVVCWLGVTDEVRKRGLDAGLLVYQDPAKFLVPFADYLRFQQRKASAGSTLSSPAQAEPVRPVVDFGRLRAEAVPGDGGQLVLGERPSMRLLQEFGIDCPQIHYARSAGDIERIAATMRYPCVMKISEPVIAHKSDCGGVVLNITTREMMLSAWNDMVSRLSAREVMVAEQIESGMEVLVGCVHDQTFGMRLTVGSGGIWTNMVSDSVTLIPPFDAEYIRSVVKQLTIWAPMNGARGQPKLAVDRLIDTIAGIASLGWSLRHELREFECNPIIVTPTRAVAADAVGFF